MKAVRAAVNRVGKDHRFELMRETDASPPLIDELNEISERVARKAPERGFTMELGHDVEGARSPTSCSRSPATGDERPSPASCGSSPATAATPATRST